MPTLLIRFPGGRYHATPWGHHVNEGLIEWPPSSWRLMRALLSTGYTALHWPAEGPPAEGRSLIEKLASVLPTYGLPAAAGAHSRHYMPLAKLKAPGAKADTSFVLAHQTNSSPIVHGHKEETTLVFDTWAQVDDGVLSVTWDLPLSGPETELLGQLAVHLGYLGRSESLVAARLAGAAEAEEEPNCFPEAGLSHPGRGWEQVPLLAATETADYIKWRERALAEALAKLPSLEGRNPTKKQLDQRSKTESAFPPDLIAALQVTTSWLREQGWSQPPGSRKVFYWRRTDALDVGVPAVRIALRRAEPVMAMLLSMATQSGNDHALPPIIRTLPQAELLHRTLVDISSGDGRLPSLALRGCDNNGNALRGPHQHAHVVPIDLDEDEHLDHILIWAPMGLDEQAQRAIRAVRQTFTKGGVSPMRLATVAAGDFNCLAGLRPPWGQTLGRLLGTPSGCRTWVTQTPFVPPRHLKAKGRNTLDGQVQAELASRGLPPAEGVECLDLGESPSFLRFRHYVRRRGRGPLPPVDCAFALRLTFATPVRGPICLGYASHFGLGLFRAVDNAKEKEARRD